MNEFIQKWTKYVVQNIKTHPIQSGVTLLTGIGVIFTIVSNTHVDLYITSQQVRTNAQEIQQLSHAISDDHNSIIILQQIAKDNVVSQQNLANQISQLNSTFSTFLLNKIQ